MAKSPDAFRTIREVAEWLDTPAHVLRFWESKFSQVKPVKRAGGRRYYRPADMLLLGGIKQLLHDDGMTIKGVNKMLRSDGVKAVSAKSQPLGDDLDNMAGQDVIEGSAVEVDNSNVTLQTLETVDEKPNEEPIEATVAPEAPVQLHPTDVPPEQPSQPSISDPETTPEQPAAEAQNFEPFAAEPETADPVSKSADRPDDTLSPPISDTPESPVSEPPVSEPPAMPMDPVPAAEQISQPVLPDDPEDGDLLPDRKADPAPVLIRLLETPKVQLNANNDQLQSLLARLRNLQSKMSDHAQG